MLHTISILKFHLLAGELQQAGQLWQCAIVLITQLSFFSFCKQLFWLSTATQLFRLMDKYRPETKQEKNGRLKARAEERVKGKDDVPTKRPPVVRSGINTVTTLIEKKKAQLVVIAHDVEPIEVCVMLVVKQCSICLEFVWVNLV